MKFKEKKKRKKKKWNWILELVDLFEVIGQLLLWLVHGAVRLLAKLF
ncbi:hypothetical protein [Neobacillus dielmonensis]|nr:hypothetical protein [Neobacillus dielmonensis]